MVRIVLTGANGQLGRAIQRQLKAAELEVTPLTSAELDFMSGHLVEGLALRPFDVLINCAAYTAVDKAETDAGRAMQINAHAVRQLAEACMVKNAVFIHFSTDYVYSAGLPAVPLAETDKTDPVSVYGQTKLEGEKAALSLWQKTIVIRTSWLYGEGGANFVKTMCGLVEKTDSARVVYDQVGTPTYAGDLATAVEVIIRESQKQDFSRFGIYNYSNEGVCSWYDFAVEIFRLKKSAMAVQPVLSGEYPTAAKRPHYSVLNKQKIKDSFGIKIPHWRESLEKYLISD